MEPDETVDPRLVQDIRVLGLKLEINEVVGGEMTFHEPEGGSQLPGDVDEAFLENVLAFEKAPWTTHLDELANAGLELPAPDDVPDADMEALLWKAIRKLADIGCSLENTEHLSDRGLYTWLYSEGLREQIKAGIGGWHTGPVGSGDEESMRIYFRYYADEKYRKSWKKDWPNYDMPLRENPPYDRDRLLPVLPIPEMQIPAGWDDDDDEP
jgi:hypothetical protein